MELRKYQSEAIDELWGAFHKRPGENLIMNCCVGAGKSLMIAAAVQRAINEYPATRVIVIAHQKELIQQNLGKLKSIWPTADVGVYSAAIGRKQHGHQITYATIGSIYKDAHKMGAVHLVMCDEAHMISTKEVGMWRKFINDLKRYGNEHLCVIGWTGTPFRNGGIWLTAGDAPLFTSIAATVSMRQLLDDGFLCPLVPVQTATRIDTSGVKTAAGDYVISELARVSDTQELVNAACDEIVRMAHDRRRWLIFAVNVEHAKNINAALRGRGIASNVVTGDTPKDERERMLADYAADRLRAMVSVGVLTTGFDQSDIDFIALLRATKSPTLAIQMCGRGMRRADDVGKVDCAFADFTDTIETLGPIDLIKGRLPNKQGSGEAPFKLCPDCGSRNAASATHCTSCGFEFPPPERVKHGTRASSAAILSTQVAAPETIWHEVTRVAYAVHSKPDKPNCLRVDYWSGIRQVASSWQHFDRPGYPRTNALSWYAKRRLDGNDKTPSNTKELVAWINSGLALKQPTRIATRKNGRFMEVIDYEFND